MLMGLLKTYNEFSIWRYQNKESWSCGRVVAGEESVMCTELL